ncbi:hypothetical protein L6452_22542 [Arctium lappa]|uniref:Uncharacterized protein n=1 Tax=Arctium lappa TaxID=4217 RepID=A0ACB9B1D1_ARCLA|nr:hypothetical protein L6452_22542 [Arctium lappa]
MHVPQSGSHIQSRGTRTYNGHQKFINSNSTVARSTFKCSYCHDTSHSLLNCLVRYCKFCNKKHPRHYAQDCYKHPNGGKIVVGSATSDQSFTPIPGSSISSSNYNPNDLCGKDEDHSGYDETTNV